MAKHLPDNLESPVQQTELVMPKTGTSLGGRLDETIEIFNELRGRYALYSDFLPENVASKQLKLAREINDQIEARKLFLKGERIEIGGQTSTVRSTTSPDFYFISKNIAHRAFFDGQFVTAQVVPIPTHSQYQGMGNTKYEYAESTSNRYGLTFMFEKTAIIIPSLDYPFNSDIVEMFPRPFTFIPVEYPGVEMRSVDAAREEVMEIFNGTDRSTWEHPQDLRFAADMLDEEANRQ